jgi:hypothetical protein
MKADRDDVITRQICLGCLNGRKPKLGLSPGAGLGSLIRDEKITLKGKRREGSVNYLAIHISKNNGHLRKGSTSSG